VDTTATTEGTVTTDGKRMDIEQWRSDEHGMDIVNIS